MISTGVVKWFSNPKGYGFIIEDGTALEYFLHFKNIIGEGYKGCLQFDEVSFTPSETEKGLVALNVEVLPKKKDKKISIEIKE